VLQPCKGATEPREVQICPNRWSKTWSIWSTAPNIGNPGFRKKIKRDSTRIKQAVLLNGKMVKHWDSPAIIIGGVEDHVHALFSQSKKHALMKIVEEVKKGSSKWMKTDGPRNKDFYWQSGYAAFSVNESNVPDVRKYIENQEEHHREMMFQDELRLLLDRHHIAYDERFLWD
jgi:putative transposase